MGDLHARLDLNHLAAGAIEDQNRDAHCLSGGFYLSAVACVQDHLFFVTGGLNDARSFDSDAAITIASEKFNPLGELSGSIGNNRGCFGGALCGERVGSLAAYVDGAAAVPRTLVWRGSGAWILRVGSGCCEEHGEGGAEERLCEVAHWISPDLGNREYTLLGCGWCKSRVHVC
jgi:hypothetical protein